MANDRTWTSGPALGIVVAKLVELNLRALRLEAARRDKRTARMLELSRKMSR